MHIARTQKNGKQFGKVLGFEKELATGIVTGFVNDMQKYYIAWLLYVSQSVIV